MMYWKVYVDAGIGTSHSAQENVSGGCQDLCHFLSGARYFLVYDRHLCNILKTVPLLL